MTTNQTWQPIEMAPRDGARILATDPKNNLIGIVSFDGLEWELVNSCGTGLSIGFYPTHWMPLPQPPLDNHQHDGVE